MQFKRLLTMDEELSFSNGEVREVKPEIKRLFPNDDVVEVIESGISYVIFTSYIIQLTF